MKQKNARFWIWWNESHVKLTLEPGQTITIGYGGATDEGNSWHSETYEFDGEVVECSIADEGRDCDGGYGHYANYCCHIDRLKQEQACAWDDNLAMSVEVPGVMLPEWKERCRSQYDQFAEAAGY